MSEATRKTRARLAGLTARHGANAPETVEAKREHRIRSVEECIERNLADCPPLTDDQVTKLRDVFTSAVASVLTVRRQS